MVKILQTERTSFAFVVSEYLREHVNFYAKNLRDLDLIPESLGPLQWSFYLTSNHAVPERMKNRIDQKTSSIMENGLYKFYENLDVFLVKMRASQLAQPEEDQERAIKIGDLRSPLIFCIICLGFASVIFVLELFMHRMEMRRR